MTIISGMALLNLFHKSKDCDINLTIHQQKVLSVLLTFVNSKTNQNYQVWPNSKTLIERTGMSDKTLERARKVLLSDGWLTCIEPARGVGHSCVYHISPQKILDVAQKSGEDVSGYTKPKEYKVPDSKPQHKRDTTGLKQNSSKVFSKMFHGVEYNTQADYDEAKRAFECSLAMLDDDPNCSF